MTEEWRPVPGFPGYQASDEGRIRGPRGWVLSQTWSMGDRHTKSRLVVTVYCDGRKLTRKVHALVCLAFHGPKPADKHLAAHNDGDRAHNRPGNLAWKTYAENTADAVRHGTHGKRKPKCPSPTVSI